MIKLSKRLGAIADLLNLNDSILDVGTDHGLLPIYLKTINKNYQVIASDVNENALNNCLENMKKYKVSFKTFLTSGTSNIDSSLYNTISISGMGAYNIIDIIKNTDLTNVKKLVIESNNNHDILREAISSLGFYLRKEIIVYENNIYYTIMEFKKGTKKLRYQEKELGLLDKKYSSYYKYLIICYKKLLKLIPKLSIKKRIIIRYKIHILKKFI